jgi:hypothetical protein
MMLPAQQTPAAVCDAPGEGVGARRAGGSAHLATGGCCEPRHSPVVVPSLNQSEGAQGCCSTVDTLAARRPPPPTVRKAARESPALRLVEPGVVETVTPPTPAPARSQRSRCTTRAATTVTGFHRFTVAVSIAARAPSVKWSQTARWKRGIIPPLHE